ncbi:6-carboxytetrahydropterin synthase QueD [Patescibacteria group bacterium]|uniref:Putative 6-Pyruvoyl tetrahydrobiopterin synthase n=1 Tax=viral metagenome TaxID=1070528 RepID=A0A6M3MFW7_9ZZZZ|nr:6-carboxytetrahydropterin synthase QueD [Patescibacteria group bacterium]MBU0847521.1 6-carboxytetrahydropterin synthase QueD [Patescibacteria group bacterium]
MISICRKFEFHAAHHLPNHEGKCKDVHGHSYILEVEVTGPKSQKGSEIGMIMDFGFLKKIVNDSVLEKLDHKNLNDIWNNPTAEEMIEDIVRWIDLELEKFPSYVERVRLWETSNSYAEWKAE